VRTGDQTRKNCYGLITAGHSQFLTRMLTRDLFAAANLVVKHRVNSTLCRVVSLLFILSELDCQCSACFCLQNVQSSVICPAT